MSKPAVIEEPLRTLGISLLRVTRDGRKRLLVTSAREGDGKSTICAKLAEALASSGARILLIDANLRHSSLHVIFGVPNNQGLLQLLNGNAEIGAVVREVRPGVHLLPSGAAPGYREPLPAGENLDRLMQNAQESYDVILVDSPPVLNWSDAVQLATRTDGVIVLVRAGTTKAEDVRLLRDRLESVGAVILGSVLNAIPASSGSSGDSHPMNITDARSAAGESGELTRKVIPAERTGQ